MPDLRVRELVVVTPLIALLIFLGVYPEAAHRHRQPGGRAHHVRRTEEGPPARGGGGQVSATAVHSLWTTAADPIDEDRRAEDRIRAVVAHPDRHRRGDRRRARRGVRAAQVPLLRPGVPVRRRPRRRLRRGRRRSRPADTAPPRPASRRWAPSPSTGRRCSCRARSCWPVCSACSPSPNGGSTPRRTATASTRSPRRPRPCPAATAKRPRSRPGSPPPRCSRCCSSRSAAC